MLCAVYHEGKACAVVPSAAAVDSEIGSVFLVKIFSVISFFCVWVLPEKWKSWEEVTTVVANRDKSQGMFCRTL